MTIIRHYHGRNQYHEHDVEVVDRSEMAPVLRVDGSLMTFSGRRGLQLTVGDVHELVYNACDDGQLGEGNDD